MVVQTPTLDWQLEWYKIRQRKQTQMVVQIIASVYCINCSYWLFSVLLHRLAIKNKVVQTEVQAFTIQVACGIVNSVTYLNMFSRSQVPQKKSILSVVWLSALLTSALSGYHFPAAVETRDDSYEHHQPQNAPDLETLRSLLAMPDLTIEYKAPINVPAGGWLSWLLFFA